MPDVLIAPPPFSTEEFLSVENLQKIDDTLTEVFGVMVGLEIQPQATFASPGTDVAAEKVAAVIGFTGVVRGSCQIVMNLPAALAISRAMLGSDPAEDEIEDMIRDTASEICNLVVGGWKHRVDSLQSRVLLAPPAVMTGKDFRIHGTDSSISIRRLYCFSGYLLSLNLQIETE